MNERQGLCMKRDAEQRDTALHPGLSARGEKGFFVDLHQLVGIRERAPRRRRDLQRRTSKKNNQKWGTSKKLSETFQKIEKLRECKSADLNSRGKLSHPSLNLQEIGI